MPPLDIVIIKNATIKLLCSWSQNFMRQLTLKVLKRIEVFKGIPHEQRFTHTTSLPPF